MLFSKKKSALVRLSDCIKFGIGNCLNTTNELIGLHLKHEVSLRIVRTIAKDTSNGKIPAEEGEKKILEAQKNIPDEDQMEVASLQARLHSECLSVILNSCFALESYVNTLEYHLLQEIDYLGLFRSGHDSTAEILIDAIEKMSTLEKWEAIGNLNNGKGFDRSKSPFQDFRILFRFRNDIVHDKVADYSDDREVKRYNRKLPDPVFSFLTLRHVIFAADTYWEMISEIHNILGSYMKEFHRHYNLKPWFNKDFEDKVRKASASYAKVAEHIG